MRNNNSKFKNKRQEGFTLIEMIVAIGVFSMAMVIAMAALLNISDIQKKTNAFRVVSDGLNFAMETMAREIRMGTNFSAEAGGTSFSFTNSNDNQITYRLDGSHIEVSIDGSAPIILTGPEVEITRLLFIVRGEGVSDGLQPIVTIILSGSAGKKEKIKSSMDLQATISQRDLDS